MNTDAPKTREEEPETCHWLFWVLLCLMFAGLACVWVGLFLFAKHNQAGMIICGAGVGAAVLAAIATCFVIQADENKLCLRLTFVLVGLGIATFIAYCIILYTTDHSDGTSHTGEDEWMNSLDKFGTVIFCIVGTCYGICVLAATGGIGGCLTARASSQKHAQSVHVADPMHPAPVVVEIVNPPAPYSMVQSA